MVISSMIKSLNKFMFLARTRFSDSLVIPKRYYTVSGTPGSGAGKGGGSGGAVRESGGGLGQYGAAQEEGYFFNKQREQIEKIKEKLKKNPKKASEVSQKEEK